MLIFKLKKLPKYVSGLSLRSKNIGFTNTINEMILYCKFYSNLLKKNNVSVSFKTYFAHFSTYTEIHRLYRGSLTKADFFNIIPRTVTHGLFIKNKINRHELTYDKYKMYKRMKVKNITIPKIYYVSNDCKKNIWNNNSIFDLLHISKNNTIIAKPRCANCGKGIFIYDNEKIKKNYIYQEYVKNHEKIVELQDNKYCSTVRYVVYNKKSKITPISARININNGCIVDTPERGSINAEIDVQTGTIISDGFDCDGKKYRHHPKSKMKIKEFALPNWKNCLLEVEKICIEYKELPLIAIDIAITTKGCIILEINAGCGPILSQYSSGWLNHDFIKEHFTLT